MHTLCEKESNHKKMKEKKTHLLHQLERMQRHLEINAFVSILFKLLLPICFAIVCYRNSFDKKLTICYPSNMLFTISNTIIIIITIWSNILLSDLATFCDIITAESSYWVITNYRILHKHKVYRLLYLQFFRLSKKKFILRCTSFKNASCLCGHYASFSSKIFVKISKLTITLTFSSRFVEIACSEAIVNVNAQYYNNVNIWKLIEQHAI